MLDGTHSHKTSKKVTDVLKGISHGLVENTSSGLLSPEGQGKPSQHGADKSKENVESSGSAISKRKGKKLQISSEKGVTSEVSEEVGEGVEVESSGLPLSGLLTFTFGLTTELLPLLNPSK